MTSPLRDDRLAEIREWAESSWTSFGGAARELLAEVDRLKAELAEARSGAVLLRVMEVSGHGAWHDATTGKWVSAAGRNFSTAAEAIAAIPVRFPHVTDWSATL